MIKVNLSELIHTKVGHHQTKILDVEPLILHDLTLAGLKGALRFTRVAHGIFCEGTLKTKVNVSCIRCLTQFQVPISIELEDVLGLPGAELTPEHPVRVSESGWVDLAPLVREYVWLSIPAKPICTPDCQGLCPECGGNVNDGECICDNHTAIDPRWEALRALLDTNE